MDARRRLCWLAAVSLAAMVARSSAARRVRPAVAVLARDGKAPMRIVVADGASQRVRAAAGTLADYLGRIASARFGAATGDGADGVAVGLASDFRKLSLAGELDAAGPARREQYLLRSHVRGLYAVGATELAVEHAVWDLLYRLGCRQFFPGRTWEVVPHRRDLRLAVDVNEKPDYLHRRIWYGYGTWDHNAAPLAAWQARNRAPGAFVLNTGHAYERIISRYKGEFDKHPEYYGLLGGRRKSTKLCISNGGLRKLVVRYARDFFARSPEADSVSVDPSDGGGWCECDNCAAMGTPSDRALTLANEVSKELERLLPGRYVAMYAYSHHSPPPSIRARPRVIINVATAFLKGGRTVDENIAGWTAKGVRQFGIREYYGVFPWDHDLPGRARGGNIAYLRRTIPHFHGMGARFMSAESSDNWGPNGLGYYLATRMLWDVDEAANVDALKADFLDKAFGPAREPMKVFYDLIDGETPPLMSRDLIGRMYRCLRDAGRLATEAPIRERLDHLVLYTRYVELYRAYARAAGEGRQAAMEQLVRHAYRMRKTMMVHAKAVYREVARRDKRVTIPDEAAWNRPEGRNPWKSSAPWGRAELDGFVLRGIESNPLIGFEPVTFGRRLVPADRLALPKLPRLDDSNRGRGEQVLYTWVRRAPAAIELRVTAGLIAHYRDRGAAKLALAAVDDGNEPEADRAEVPPDGTARTVTLRAARTGLHTLTVNDGMDSTEVVWPKGRHRTIEFSCESSPPHGGRRSAYFYVPRGTKVVAGYSASAGGTLHDADGREVLKLPNGDHFAAPVKPGQAGRPWSFRRSPGAIRLMTVPPYAAAAPGAMLLPREVVDADARHR